MTDLVQLDAPPNIPECSCNRDDDSWVGESDLPLCAHHEKILRHLSWESLACLVIDYEAGLVAAVRERDELRAAARNFLSAWPNIRNHASLNASEIVALRAGWTPQPQEQEQPRHDAAEWLDWWDRGGYADPDAAIEAVEHLRATLDAARAAAPAGETPVGPTGQKFIVWRPAPVPVAGLREALRRLRDWAVANEDDSPEAAEDYLDMIAKADAALLDSDRPGLDVERLLDTASDDDVMYDYPRSMTGEPMDPILFVRWDWIAARLQETPR